jgi:hypothetical protein
MACQLVGKNPDGFKPGGPEPAFINQISFF